MLLVLIMVMVLRSLDVISCNRLSPLVRVTKKYYIKDECIINIQPNYLILLNFLIKLNGKYVNKMALNCTTLTSLILPTFKKFILILIFVNLSLKQVLLIFLLYVRQTWKILVTQVIPQWGVTFF